MPVLVPEIRCGFGMKREPGENPGQCPLLYALKDCLPFVATVSRARDGKAANKE